MHKSVRLLVTKKKNHINVFHFKNFLSARRKKSLEDCLCVKYTGLKWKLYLLSFIFLAVLIYYFYDGYSLIGTTLYQN